MFFGNGPVLEAAGGIAVHSIRQVQLVLKKGALIGVAEFAALQREGIDRMIVARLEDGEKPENEAAALIAARLAGSGVKVEPAFTGRANLHATAAGVLQVDRAAVDALNAIDESITFATLPAFAPVAAGEMVATVKIIPFAVASDILDRALAGVANPPIAVARFQPKTVAVISTVLPGLKDSVIAKTLRVMQDRLAPAGGRIGLDLRVPHETNALAAAISEAASAGADLTVIFG